MKGKQFFSRPSKVSDMSDEELYDDTDDNLMYRARRLQARRWKIIEDRESEKKFFKRHRSARLRHIAL